MTEIIKFIVITAKDSGMCEENFAVNIVSQADESIHPLYWEIWLALD